MKIVRFKIDPKARLLACLALVSGGYVCADESTSKSESKTQSATTQLEVRVQSNDTKTDSDTDQVQRNVTIAVGVAGENPSSIEDSINKLEKQMKASGIPPEIQRQAMESLRFQLKTQAEGKKSFSGKANWSSNQKSDTPQKDTSTSNDAKPEDKLDPENSNGKTITRSLFWGSSSGSPLLFENVVVSEGNPTGLAFSGQGNLSSPLGPSQKKLLCNAVSEALEQSGISSDTIAKSLEKIEKALDEFSSQPTMRFGDQKPPYRIGVGCKKNEIGDTTSGLEIESVFEDSPAAKAGIKIGDRLISVDGKVIDSLDDIISAVQSAGEEKRPIHLKAKRDNVETDYEIKPIQAGIAEMDSGMNIPGVTIQGWIPTQGKAWVTPQFPNDEKTLDKIREEFSAVRKEIEEIKELLKKLGNKP